MQNGYIKLHRELLDSKLWSCSDATFRVAVYLLLSANHAPAWHHRIRIDRGQCVRSLTRIADDCGVSRKAARYALQILEEDGFISTDSPFGAQQGHRITVCKYDTYQGENDTRGTLGAHEGTHGGNNEGTTNKNERMKEEEEALRARAREADSSWNLQDYLAAFAALRPEFAKVRPEYVKQALDAEPDPAFRPAAFRDFVRDAGGALEAPKNPTAMLAAYMRKARSARPPSNVVSKPYIPPESA